MVLSDLSLWKLLNDLVRDPEPDPGPKGAGEWAARDRQRP